jgi:hypothetical protein
VVGDGTVLKETPKETPKAVPATKQAGKANVFVFSSVSYYSLHQDPLALQSDSFFNLS